MYLMVIRIPQPEFKENANKVNENISLHTLNSWLKVSKEVASYGTKFGFAVLHYRLKS